jgi:asparagine N-glycosylation enzyme membrane subunit Stt3
VTRFRSLLPALIVVAAVSGWVRFSMNLRVAEAPDAGGKAGWFSTDPDSLYHMRRLELALDQGGHVAGRDELLDYPREVAAPIPWPGFYTRVLWLLAAPWAPPAGGPERARFVERFVATWPAIFGLVTSVLAALAAGRLFGRAGALTAGLLHALSFVSMRYSLWGNGDHHAWTSCLHAGALWAAAEGFHRLRHPRSAAGLGLVCGALLGASLASWVATLIPIALMQVTLALVALRTPHARGLGAFGLALHLAALALVLPEVAASPWPAMDLVNLSWMHAGVLLAGAGLSFSILRRPQRARWIVTRPLPVLVGLAAVALVSTGLGQGFAWLTAREPFMAGIAESQPLVGGELGLGPLAKWLGYGVFLLPVALWVGLRTRRPELLPWLVAVPVLLGLALLQRRFGEGLAAPMATLLAGMVVPLGRCLSPRVAFVVAGALATSANGHTLGMAWSRTRYQVLWHESRLAPQDRALRSALRWVRARDEPGAVLAQWDLGHLVEWVAGRPTLATNFGSYLGERWTDPWRVLGAQREEAAAELLEERGVRFVLLGADWRRNRVPMGAFSSDLESCLAARLVPRGRPGRDPALDDLGGLRLVLERRQREPSGHERAPGCWVYEVVAGARVQGRGKPGEELRVSLTLRYGNELVEWSAGAPVMSNGLATLRVPHGTDSPNGEGQPQGPARWSLGARRGELTISEGAVLDGALVRLP